MARRETGCRRGHAARGNGENSATLLCYYYLFIFGTAWSRRPCAIFFIFRFFVIFLVADGPRCHPECGQLRIFPSLPGSRLANFYCDATSALLQLVSQWLNFIYSRTNAFRYGRRNKNPTLTRIKLTTSALAGVQVTYYSRCPGLPSSSLPVCPVYRCFFFVPPRFTGGMPVYRGGSFFHARGAPPAAAHSHTRCCIQHNTTRWVLRAAANTCLRTMPCAAGELSCVPLNGWCCHAMDLVMNNDKHFMFLELF